jgi:hypothetical protein
MLKVTIQGDAGVIVLELEGKLAGPWVKELEQLWRTAGSTQRIYPVQVNLSSVTFIDKEGEDLLRRMYGEGAKLVTRGCLNKCIVEGIMERGRLEKKDA